MTLEMSGAQGRQGHHTAQLFQASALRSQTAVS